MFPNRLLQLAPTMLKTPTSIALKEAPDHHDAELVMKLYELRREPVMRESRLLINRDFWPRSADDVMALTKGDHPLNAALRQTSTYWEMAYGMVKHGILHADYMLETNGEGLLLYARMEPYLAEYRRASGPRAFANAEWVTTHTDSGRAMLERNRARIAARP
jgi:hypothetical protein